MSSGWCTIESDPGVFTALIEDIGVKNAQVEELYALDDSAFESLRPVYGLVFLFKWQDESSSESTANLQFADDPDLFFANQVINNACATQAILSILLNSPDLELGETLTEFKSFTQEFPPDLKGLAISNSDKIRTAHNSFSRAEPFVIEETKAGKDDDVYHFIAYIPFKDKVYELDGLKPGPISLGTVSPGQDWLQVACPAIQERIQRYSQSEIRFNLMAVVQNIKHKSETRLLKLQSELQNIDSAIQGNHISSDRMTDDDDVFSSLNTEELKQLKQSKLGEVSELKNIIRGEEQKYANWKEENIRRKHNYVPFLIALLQQLAKNNQLQPLIEKQLARQQEQGQNKSAAAKL